MLTLFAAMLMAAHAPSTSPAASDAGSRAERFAVRDGYRVSVAAADVTGARFLEVGDDGTLYISRPRSGDIIAMRDTDGDGVYETRASFIIDRASVHAMDFHDGWLWYATTGSIHRSRDTDGDGVADETVDVIPAGALPRGGAHWWRSLLVTPDAFYTSIGDGSNASEQTNTERQKIWRFEHDGSGKRLVASGIRNTEKLRLRPGTEEVWGVDHGADWFGRSLGETEGHQPITDLNPPDELNHYIEGGFYGHPFLAGDRVPRPEYQGRDDLLELAARTTPPKWKFRPHMAVNGFTFVDPAVNAETGAFPADHGGDLFAACHGSWNSTTPAGYSVVRVLFDDAEGGLYGSLRIVGTIDPGNGEVLARPVDCVQAPDGSVLFSCDLYGAVYRIRAAEAPGADGEGG